MKRAGMAAAAPAAAAALSYAGEDPIQIDKSFCINFTGPFCFWLEDKWVKVMAPPVGPSFKYHHRNDPDHCHHKYGHQAWMGTSSNEITIPDARELKLEIPGYDPKNYTPIGTTAFNYPQGSGNGAAPLFTLRVPIPHHAIGVRPTVVKMRCTGSAEYPYCKEYSTFASGLTFYYPSVDVDKVRVTSSGSPFFTPCFTNDESLPSATLGVNLTPLEPLDPGHVHAEAVWGAMLSMYPWMQSEINGIQFCPNFKPSECVFDPGSCRESKGPMPMVGPGNDCQVPIMTLPPGGGGTTK
jgi:hypothetical protein